MIDYASKVPSGSSLEADVCIVGAGAAGISLALGLSGSGLSVLLLEGGLLEEDACAQDCYAGEVLDEALHSPPHRYRVRSLGGSTATWGGRCVPYDPQDFLERAGIPLSGWPLSLADVEPYYRGAAALCEIGDPEFSAARAFTAVPPVFPVAPGPRVTVDGLERFSFPTHFGARYEARLSAGPGPRVLLGANVVHLALDPTGREVRYVDVRTREGNGFLVHARAFVVATGGLETPRLLLASRDVQSNGIGNDHDMVGRYYMCHLAGTIGKLEIHGPVSAVRHGYEVSPEGIYCRRRISLTAQAQRELGVANLIARLHFPDVVDPAHSNSVLSGIFLCRGFLSYEYSRRLGRVHRFDALTHLRHLANVARYPHDALAFITHWILKRKLARRKFPSVILRNRSNRFSLEINAEQRPIESSRVVLARDCDRLGMPRLRVEWRYSADDIDSVRRSMTAIAQEFEATGAGRLEFDTERVEHDMIRYGAYGGHHIGTTRMGSDPKRSVVDANCRVHGIENLYIAGSSVFPTSSQANPTFLLVALALRLADHLVHRLRGVRHSAVDRVV